MKNCLAKGDKLKAVKVLFAVCIQGIVVYMSCVIDSSFYVTHLLGRGIPNIQVGLVGMFIAIGSLLNGFYDIIYYLLHAKKFSIRAVQCSLMAVIIVNCAGQGLVEYLPEEYNQLLSAVLMMQKLFHGFVVFLGSKGYITCCMVWFPDHVNLTVGLVVSTNYIGGALGVLMGGYLYQLLSFNQPYFVASLICAVCWLYNLIVLPSTSDPLYCKAKAEDSSDNVHRENGKSDTSDNMAENSDESHEKGLSWLVIFPLIAHGLTTLSEGFCTAITTPYLLDKFGIEIGQGSSYVFVLFISFIIGSAGAGYILQMGWISNYKMMIAGGVLTIIGLLFIFPGQGVKVMYDNVPKLAYLGYILMGVGNQLISIAALEALEETHVTIARRRYTKKNKSLAASLWLLGWWTCIYVGHLVALMVMKFMTFTTGGWLVAGCSGVSACICIVFEVWAIRSRIVVVRPLDSSPTLSTTTTITFD